MNIDTNTGKTLASLIQQYPVLVSGMQVWLTSETRLCNKILIE